MLVPCCAEDVWQTVIRKVGPAWKHASSDLYMLGLIDDPKEKGALIAFTIFLQALGRRAFPAHEVGIPKAGTEVMELASILIILA